MLNLKLINKTVTRAAIGFREANDLTVVVKLDQKGNPYDSFKLGSEFFTTSGLSSSDNALSIYIDDANGKQYVAVLPKDHADAQTLKSTKEGNAKSREFAHKDAAAAMQDAGLISVTRAEKYAAGFKLDKDVTVEANVEGAIAIYEIEADELKGYYASKDQSEVSPEPTPIEELPIAVEVEDDTNWL